MFVDDIEHMYECQAPIEKEEVGASQAAQFLLLLIVFFFFWQISYSSLPYRHENSFNNGLYCRLGARYVFFI